MSFPDVGLVMVGLACLMAGGEALVRGASRLAAAAGISPLVIGLTVVAFGTSAPELAVSVQAGLAGSGGIAVANVVGSNIVNVLLILGLCALVAPLAVGMRLLRLEVPLMIAVSVLAFALAADGRIGRIEGGVLLVLMAAYMGWTIVSSRREPPTASGEFDREYGPGRLGEVGGRGLSVQAVWVVAGLGLLVLGARWLVSGATALARSFGVEETIIGLTIVAAGTSLPELAASLVATLRGERDIAVGNVVGSNIFNLLMILGAAGLVSPGGLAVAPSLLRLDFPVMVVAAAACLPVFFTGLSIARWEGALFVGYYGAYAAWLVLEAREHEVLPVFSSVMLTFVLPLTAITLAILVLRASRRGRTGSRAASR